MKQLQPLLMTIFLAVAGIAFAVSASNAHAVIYPVIWGDNRYEWITNVTFGAIDSTSGRNSNGYGDYTYAKTGFIARVRPGGSYPLRITIHPDPTWCDENISAFFDWNRDGDFTDSGEKVAIAENTCLAGPHTVYVKVPSNAVPGETRMRIVLKYYDIPKSYGWLDEGEAEDYSVLTEYPTITGDNRSEWITNVTLEETTNPTGRATNGYGDYTYWATARAMEVVQNESYAFRVTISPDIDWCDENVTAFLDWNHDGDFGDYSEQVVVADGTCSAGPHVVNLKVPINAVAGMTRMRVVLRWRFAPAISGYISGEAEDYTLKVQKRKYPWNMFIPAINGQSR
jgi:hypothetical protein